MSVDDDGLVTFNDFVRIDIRVGRIVEVEEFPEARRPAWKLQVDFGPELGVKRSSAQITNPHFSSTRREAMLSFAARAYSGRAASSGSSAASARVATPRPQNSFASR